VVVLGSALLRLSAVSAPQSRAWAEAEFEVERFAGSAASPRCTLTFGEVTHGPGAPNGTRAKRACRVFTGRKAQPFVRAER